MSSSLSSIPILPTAAIAAGMVQLRAEQRAVRLAEMRRRLGITQTQVAARMGITQGRVSAIEHAKPGTTELRTLAAYVEALGGRLKIIADFGDQRLAFTEPGTEAAFRKPRGTSCPAGRGHDVPPGEGTVAGRAVVRAGRGCGQIAGLRMRTKSVYRWRRA